MRRVQFQPVEAGGVGAHGSLSKLRFYFFDFRHRKCVRQAVVAGKRLGARRDRLPAAVGVRYACAGFPGTGGGRFAARMGKLNAWHCAVLLQ